MKIKIGDKVKTERGIGEVRNIIGIYAIDVFYGDHLSGYCYKIRGDWPGWDRILETDVEAVLKREKK